MLNNKMKAAYLRCSTTRQDLESQEALLNNWAKKNNEQLIFYKDFAISGKTTDREGINLLLKDAESHKFDAVVVAELSRIGRSMGFIYGTIERLSKIGIKVILAQTGTTLNSESVEGVALLGGLGIAAAVELKLIEERNRRGREKIKRLGIKTGRKFKEEKGLSLEAVKALRDKGLSMRLIGKELNSSPATIMRILHSLDAHKTNIHQSNQIPIENNQKSGVVS